MIGFDPVTLSAAYILASVSATECPAPEHVAAHVEFVKTDNPVVTDQTKEQLASRYRTNLDSSMSIDGKWITGGATVMEGMALKAGIDVEFKAHNAANGQACLAVSAVTYTVTYSPTVYIASDLSDCVKKATLAHEQRHVDHDSALANAYVPLIEKALTDYVDNLGAKGPLSLNDVDAVKDRLTSDIMQAVKPKWGDLSFAVRDKKGEVDTEEDYKKDTAACPGEFPAFDGGK